MKLDDAIITLDEVIPSPDNKMVDAEHQPIATAWSTIRQFLIDTKWKKPKDSLPKNEDTIVLVICVGKPAGNIHLRNALQLATYNNEDGWIIEEYPEWKNPTIRYWSDIRIPSDIQEENREYLSPKEKIK